MGLGHLRKDEIGFSGIRMDACLLVRISRLGRFTTGSGLLELG